MRAREIGALVLLASLALGGDCGGGSGSGGSAALIDLGEAVDETTSSGLRVRCTFVGGRFPPGFDFDAGDPDRLLVAELAPPALVPYDVRVAPPVVGAPGVPSLPADSDGDGAADDPGPVLDGILGVEPGLAFATASLLEQVLFVDPASGRLLPFDVTTPPDLPGRFPLLPPRGTSARRTAVSTLGCVEIPPGALDSFGERVTTSPGCPAGTFATGFTSGAAVAASRLFVSMSNLGERPGQPDTQFLPGRVLVYDLDLAASPPRVTPTVPGFDIATTAFNPTDVTAVTTPGGRELVLVSGSGAIGIVADDPSTPEIESAGLVLSPSAIDVIDPAVPALVATVPLGLAGLSFDRLAVDPTSRVAVAGGAVSRALFAIDLMALDAIPGAPAFVTLDGSDPAAGNVDARIFDAVRPLSLPRRDNGPPAATCSGLVQGTAFDATGTRLFASEFCDGVLVDVDVDLAGAPVPVPRDRFRVGGVTPVVAAVGVDSLGRSRAIGALRSRPGGAAAQGTPDLFFLVGLEQGQLCAVSTDQL